MSEGRGRSEREIGWGDRDDAKKKGGVRKGEYPPSNIRRRRKKRRRISLRMAKLPSSLPFLLFNNKPSYFTI